MQHKTAKFNKKNIRPTHTHRDTYRNGNKTAAAAANEAPTTPQREARGDEEVDEARRPVGSAGRRVGAGVCTTGRAVGDGRIE